MPRHFHKIYVMKTRANNDCAISLVNILEKNHDFRFGFTFDSQVSMEFFIKPIFQEALVN